MTKQITLEEALKLVSFHHSGTHGWRVSGVNGNVFGNVGGSVYGTITGYKWKYVETPKDKLQRLITESGDRELIDAFNQMENN